MSIFEQALENLRTAFAPQQSADNAPPFNPFELNAYGIGTGTLESEKHLIRKIFSKAKPKRKRVLSPPTSIALTMAHLSKPIVTKTAMHSLLFRAKMVPMSPLPKAATK